MAEAITTIKILKKDRKRLGDLFGQPTHIAFHKVIILCPHPETMRTYTSAIINGDFPLEEGVQVKSSVKISGFRCASCGHYVFQDPEIVE